MFVTIVLVVFCTVSIVRADIANGSFETGDLTGWEAVSNYPLYPTSGGYTAGSAAVPSYFGYIVALDHPVTDGEFSAHFQASYTAGTVIPDPSPLPYLQLSQTFEVTEGQRLAFDCHIPSGTTTGTLSATVDSTVLFALNEGNNSWWEWAHRASKPLAEGFHTFSVAASAGPSWPVFLGACGDYSGQIIIDNVRLLDRAPRTYAVVVGSRAPSAGTVDAVRGDLDMANVAARLNWAYNVQTLQYNWSGPGSVAADVANAVNYVATDALPGDTLIFFYSGHGSGSSDPGVNESINATDGGYYEDNELTAVLADERLSGVNKIVLLDSCHSGGFLTSDYPLDRDMATLSNISFIAAATEDGVAFTDPTNGFTSYFTNAILPGLTADATFESLWALAQNAGPDAAVGYYKDEGFGMVAWDVVGYASPDFDRNARLDGSVPEPATLSLLGMGLAVLALRRRR